VVQTQQLSNRVNGHVDFVSVFAITWFYVIKLCEDIAFIALASIRIIREKYIDR